LKLTHVQIRNYKCIEDTGEFSVADVTALVGKNESGKTAVLTAIEKLNAAIPGRGKFTSLEYPRRHWRPSQTIPNDPPAIVSKWRLEESELNELTATFGNDVVLDPVVTISKSYDNELQVMASLDEAALIEHLVTAASLTDAERVGLGPAILSLDALKAALTGMSPPGGGYAALHSTLAKTLPDGIQTVTDAIKEYIPRIIYFSDYNKLSGQVSLEAFLQRKAEKKGTWADALFEALLSLAGTTAQEVQKLDQFEELNASLRAVSNHITDQIFQYWTQNQHLEVVLRFDAARTQDPAPFNAGHVFRTRIDNKRHKADTSFDDRSTGFVWFFSFLVWFDQLKARYGRGLLVLLDEPGLTLHARAQADLLRYMNERLKPHHQVIYSTHSPFMIDPDNLLAARTVEDVVGRDGKILGTKVSDRVLSTDPDTISPLQRALDYEITQSLFVGRYTLLVEGPSDLAYLKWFSGQLELKGKKGLDYRWTMCLCGGVDKVPPFASLFAANGLRLAALVDSSSGIKQKLQNATKALGEGRVLTTEPFAGKPEADIEDIFDQAFYCDLVNHAYDLGSAHRCSGASIDKKGRIVKQIEAHFNLLPTTVEAFDHYKPAAWLFDHPDEAAKLDGFDASAAHIEKLIAALNALI
jgi:predicted ATPase